MDKNIVIILAGGVGSRTGLDRPKQFVEVLGRPILAYTCDIFQKNQEYGKRKQHQQGQVDS